MMAVPQYTPGAMPDSSDLNYDRLQATDTSYADAYVQVPWERTKNPRGETNPGQGPMEYEMKKINYLDATNWLYDKYANDNTTFSKVQLHMAAAGFMGKNPNFTPGSPDDLTQASWTEILKIAAASDKTPMEIIDEAIEREGGLDAAMKKRNVSAGGMKSDIRMTHPDDIMMTAKEVSRKVLGKGWDETQLRNFVAAYQAQEQAEGSIKQGSGATYTAAPSMEAAAETAARAQNPVAAQATDWDNAAQMMMQAFKILGGGSAE